MKPNTFVLFILFLFIQTYASQAQCIDTNTLLDSIYSLKMEELNQKEKLVDRRHVLEINSKGDKYLMLIVDKIFKNYHDSSYVYGKDSSLIGDVKHLKNNYIMKVEDDTLHAYKLALLFSTFGYYLISLDQHLTFIEGVAFHTFDPTFYYINQKTKKTESTHRGGISTGYSQNIFTQNRWNEVTERKSGKVKKETKYEKKYKIDVSGRFILLK